MATASPAGVYRPRRPERTVLYRVLSQHFERYLEVHDERFARSHGPLGAVRVTELFLDSDPPSGREVEALRETGSGTRRTR